jgi:RND family efflux transporter MFP subunit
MEVHGRILRCTVCWLLALFPATQAWAQGSGVIRYSEAIRHPVRQFVTLPGSIESRTESVIAAEVMGLVRQVAVRPGQRVRRGDLLVQLDTDWLLIELDAARSNLQIAEAQLDLAQRQLERAQELFAKKVISQYDLDTASSESTRWEGERLRAGAEIRRCEFRLAHSEIRAPFNGAIVAKRTEPGQWVEQGGAVVELVATDQLEVRVEVPERYFGQLAAKAPAEVRLEALGDEALAGVVTSVIPRADARARTFPIKVGIDDHGGKVGVGMLAEVALPLGTRREALLIPKDAVVRTATEATETVYRILADGTVEPVVVRSGRGYGVWVEASGPLEPGDRLVTRGNERLRPGQAVDARPLEYPLP